MINKYIGILFHNIYNNYIRVVSKLFSILISGSFAEYGINSVICPPARINGNKYISIGSGIYIGSGSWLQTISLTMGNPVLKIGNNANIAGNCVISSAKEVIIEDSVLMARNVYISDHIHKYSDLNTPIQDQGLDKVLPVKIKLGAWLGQNVVICPGVTVGAHAVIGANSVVNTDIPDYAIAVGAPAKIVKTINNI